MYENSSIIIDRAANGFYVRIPQQIEQRNNIQQDPAEFAARVATKMRRLQDEDLEDTENELSQTTVSDSFPVAENVFVFKTFPEVLNFLKSKFS